MNSEQFIKKARKIHGDKYDYSKVEYVNTNTKVCVICPIHGEFFITPSSHLRGHGCGRCTKSIRKDAQNRFISKANKLYDNKYDYSKVKYVNSETKVCIICPIHGEFWKTPHQHLKGFACNECAKKITSQKLSMTTEQFIEKARKIHGDKYDYSKTDLMHKDEDGKVIITCPIHGDFKQTPTVHFNSIGCPTCAFEQRINKRRMSLDDFKAKSLAKYGNTFDFTKTTYINAITPLTITCRKHGDFIITPHDFLYSYKYGCPECSKEIMQAKNEEKEKKKNNEKITKALEKTKILSLKFNSFIEQARKIHGDKYDYSKVEYINNRTKVCIICPIHGEFWQTPHNHIKGHACHKCAIEKTKTKLVKTQEQFIQDAKKVHGDKYDYSKVKYVNNNTKVCIICPQHGEFWQTPAMHYNEKQGCPLCNVQSSKDEIEIYNFIKDNTNYKIIQRDKQILKGKEIDIFIPDLMIGIEYNGLIWHSELYVDDTAYHLNKTLECEKQGIKLIHIFADEWFYKKDIVKSKLLHMLHSTENLKKINGRKCSVSEIEPIVAKIFLDKNHIQGFHQSSVYLGCFFENTMIGVMSFMNCNKKKQEWELNRFATDINLNCIGVGGKLLSYFIKHYDYKIIKSFADRRWTTITNNLYLKLNFELEKILPPDYSYIPKHTTYKRIHKFNCRKQILHKKYNLPLSWTENEMTKHLDFYKIWNCGLLKYVLKHN